MRPLFVLLLGIGGIASIVASGGGSGDGSTDTGSGGGGGGGGGGTTAAATWFKSFGGTGDDAAYSAVPTSDGGYAFTGVLNDRDGAGDLWLVKLDALGDIQWQRAYGKRLLLENGLWSQISTYRRPAQGPDGSIWFLGSGRLDNSSTGRVELVVAKLGPDGNPAWAKSFDSGTYPGHQLFTPGDEIWEDPATVTPTADGGALVASWNDARVLVPTTGAAGELRDARYLWLQKLSPTGFVQWQRRITDDEFLYARRAGHGFFNEPQDAIYVREGADGSLLLNIVTLFANTWCAECSELEFLSTRLVHLRSGGDLIVNARMPYDLVPSPWEVDRATDRALPAGLVIDDDADGEPEGYFLAGAGTDVTRVPAFSTSLDSMAMVVKLGADGFVDRRNFYSEWPEGSTLSAIERACNSGGECRLLVAGSAAQTEACDRGTPVLAEINEVDLDLVRAVGLERDSSPTTCFALEPTRLDVIPAQGAAPWPFILRGKAGSRWEDPRTQLGVFASALPPPGQTAIGTWTVLSLDAYEATVSFTPDGQALGVALVADTATQRPAHVLTRVSSAGDVTLSQPLRTPDAVVAAYEAGLGVAETADRGFVVVGESSSFGAGTNLALWALKVDRDGRIVWQRQVPGLSAEVRPSVLPTADGVVFGARTLVDSGVVLVKLDVRGDLAWRLRLPSWGCVTCEVRLAALPGGDIVAVGSAWRSTWMARATAAGALVWMQRYHFEHGYFSDVDVTADGNVLVTGQQADQPAAWLFTPDATPRWSRTYAIAGLRQGLALSGDPESGTRGANRASLLPGGGFLLAFNVDAPPTYDGNVLLLRADANGVALWERLIGARYGEDSYDLEALPDGGALLAGRSTSLGDRAEAWVARLGADGRVAAGCNAGLADYTQQLDAPKDLGTLFPRILALALRPLPAIEVAALAADGAEFLPSASEVVVARQCSGSASPEVPGPAPTRFRLTLTSDQQFPGGITSSPAGISCGTALNACGAPFDAGTFVILRPDPAVSGRVTGWQGCDSVSQGFCFVQVTADKTVKVFFRDDTQHGLSITAITGDGGVRDGATLDCRSVPGGIQGTCGAVYPRDNAITLIAVPGVGQTVLAWGGDCVQSADPTRAVVVMSAPKTCSITFSGAPPGSPTLEIVTEAFDVGVPTDPAPIARVASSLPGIDCGTDCTERFASGTVVTLTGNVDSAAVAAGWEFDRFVCAGIPAAQLRSRNATFTMNADVSCAARYSNSIERLFVNISNGASQAALGRVVSEPAALDCTATCDVAFTRGETVMLRARPTQAAIFDTWSGCDQTGADPNPGAVPLQPGQIAPPVCYVTMNDLRAVGAFFERINAGVNYQLTVAFTGPGSPPPGGFVSSTPAGISCSTEGGTCSSFYAPSTVVRLVAGAYPGSLFGQFVGCTRVNPDGDPVTPDCEVSMVDDRFIEIRLLRP